MRRDRASLWLALALTALALMLAGLFPVSNSDTFGHLAAGREIAALGSVPSKDSFSFWKPTPQPWHNYEWLSALVFWEAFDLFSYNGLIGLKLLLLAMLAGLLVWRAWQSEGNPSAVLCGLLLVAAIPAVRFRLTERPHLFGMVFGALYLVGLPRLAAPTEQPSVTSGARGWIAGLTIAQLAWVNLHGSNLFGITLTGIYLAAYFRRPIAARRLAVLLVLQLLAGCVSPFGPAILKDAINHVFNPEYRQAVSEWSAWSSEDPIWFFIAPIVQTLVLASLVPAMLRQGPSGWASMGVAALLALMALRSVRFVAEYLLLSAALLAEPLARLLKAWPPKRLWSALLPVGVALLALAPAGAARLPPLLPMGLGNSIRDLPAGSAAWLAESIPNPRVLAAMEDSWYLTFALPGARVLLDGRVPFYGPEHVRMISRAYDSQTLLKRLLDRYGVDTVVVKHVFRAQYKVLQTMRGLTGWRLVMIENRYATFTRFIPERRALLERRALTELVPSYQIGFVLDPDAKLEAIDRELAMIARYPATGAYRNWVAALQSLRPLARAGGRAGLRAPRNPAERELARSALPRLRAAADTVEDVPTIYAAYAMAAVAACDLERARQAIKDAAMATESRETLLLAQEIALRENRTESVREFLLRAYALEPVRGDPWLAALSDSLNDPPTCP